MFGRDRKDRNKPKLITPEDLDREYEEKKEEHRRRGEELDRIAAEKEARLRGGQSPNANVVNDSGLPDPDDRAHQNVVGSDPGIPGELGVPVAHRQPDGVITHVTLVDPDAPKELAPFPPPAVTPAQHNDPAVAPTSPPEPDLDAPVVVLEPPVAPPVAPPNSRPSVPLAPVTKVDAGPQRQHPASSATDSLVVAPLMGNGSTVGSADWWDVSPNRGWFKLTSSGLSADYLCDAGTIGETAVAAGSMRGWKHQLKGEQNEDSFYLGAATDRNGKQYVVAVLADGLSSASQSGYGSRRITQMVGRGIASRIETASSVDKSWIDPELAGVLAVAAQRISSYHTSDYGAPVVEPSELGERDVLVTLTVAIVEASVSESGTRHAVVGFIGDSPCFVLGPDGWEKKTAVDPSEEIVENRTRAFPIDKVCSTSEFDVGMDQVVCLFSDGVGNFIGHGDQKLAVGEYLRSQWQKPVNLLTFLNHLSFNLNSADDDRTAIAIWPAVEIPE